MELLQNPFQTRVATPYPKPSALPVQPVMSQPVQPVMSQRMSYMPVKRNRRTNKNKKCKIGYRKISRCVRKNKLRLQKDRCPPGYRFRSDTRECEPVERFKSNFNFYQQQ